MKNRIDSLNNVQDSTLIENITDSKETRVSSAAVRYFKNILHIASMAAVVISLNSCFAGFVATEPAYVEFARPPRPSNLYIWIDGDYAWNNQTHLYVQRAGYWERPRQNQTFVSGHWQATPKGKSWAPGHWQKETKKVSKSRR